METMEGNNMDLDILGTEEKSPLEHKVEKELFENRIIMLNEDISGYTIDSIIPLIKLINIRDKDIPVEQRKIIELHITSGGGEVYSGWQICSTIINSKTPIHTYVEGYAMSMAVPIFLSGHKRYLGKYSTLMYHELSGSISGSRQETKRVAEEYDRLQAIYDKFIIERTSLTQEILDKHQDRVNDWYINPELAMEYNFAHELI